MTDLTDHSHYPKRQSSRKLLVGIMGLKSKRASQRIPDNRRHLRKTRRSVLPKLRPRQRKRPKRPQSELSERKESVKKPKNLLVLVRIILEMPRW